jgi:hypothetical protein
MAAQDNKRLRETQLLYIQLRTDESLTPDSAKSLVQRINSNLKAEGKDASSLETTDKISKEDVEEIIRAALNAISVRHFEKLYAVFLNDKSLDPHSAKYLVDEIKNTLKETDKKLSIRGPKFDDIEETLKEGMNRIRVQYAQMLYTSLQNATLTDYSVEDAAKIVLSLLKQAGKDLSAIYQDEEKKIPVTEESLNKLLDTEKRFKDSKLDDDKYQKLVIGSGNKHELSRVR